MIRLDREAEMNEGKRAKVYEETARENNVDTPNRKRYMKNSKQTT